MAYENRQTFGLSTVSFFTEAEGTHIVTLGDANSIALTQGRTSVDNQTSSGVRMGEHTSMWEPEVTVGGVMGLTPSARRIIEGAALISGTDAAITGMPAARVVSARSGDWSATTFTTTSSTVPGLYQVTATSSSVASWRLVGRLQGGVSNEDSVVTANIPTSTNYPATGVALVAVEPVVDARASYVGGRPGSNPPVVSIVAVTDPTTYSEEGERNAKSIFVPRAVCQTSPLNLTAREISTGDLGFKVLYDDTLNGHWLVNDLLGISA